MKTKNIRNLVVLGLMLLTILGCSKFEDGPKISFRSVIKRMYGTYHIEYLSKNGTDLSSFWNQYYNLKFEIKEQYDASSENSPSMRVSGYIDSCGTMKYYEIAYEIHIFNENNIQMYLKNYMFDTTLYPNRYLYPVLVTTDDSLSLFDVTRLTNNEMWLKMVTETNNVEIHFKE